LLKIFGHKDCFTDKGGFGVAQGRSKSMLVGTFKNGLCEGYCEYFKSGVCEGTNIKGVFKEGKLNGEAVKH